MTDGGDLPDDVHAIPLTRRQVIAAGALAAAGGAGAAEAFGTGGDGGSLTGGAMTLDQDYKLAESERTLYQGPDSAKGAINGQEGDRYEAVDTGVTYHWDDAINGWSGPHSIGSSTKPVPEVVADEAVITGGRPWYDVSEYADGSGTDADPWTNWTSITDQLPTASWTATFNSPGTGPYGVLYFPSGVYELTSRWDIPEYANLKLIGDSQSPSVIGFIDETTDHEGESVILCRSSTGEAIKLPRDSNDRALVALDWEDMTVKQSSENMTADGGTVVDLKGWHIGRIDKVSVVSVDSGNGHKPSVGVDYRPKYSTNISEVGQLRIVRMKDYGIRIEADHSNFSHLVTHNIKNTGAGNGIGVEYISDVQDDVTIKTIQMFTCDIGLDWKGGGFMNDIQFENCDTTIKGGRDPTETPVIGRVGLSGTDYDGALAEGRIQVLSGEAKNKFLNFKSGYWHEEKFLSNDAYSTNQSGSGSDSFGAFGYQLGTGSTADSLSGVGLFRKVTRVTTTWDKSREWRCQASPDSVNDVIVLGMGDFRGGDAVDRYVGFIVEGGDIKGITGDGSSQSKTTLISGASTGLHDFYCEHSPGNQASFWVDKDPNASAADGTISTNLPSGTTKSDLPWSAAVENPGNASNIGMNLKEVMFRQYPA